MHGVTDWVILEESGKFTSQNHHKSQKVIQRNISTCSTCMTIFSTGIENGRLNSTFLPKIMKKGSLNSTFSSQIVKYEDVKSVKFSKFLKKGEGLNSTILKTSGLNSTVGWKRVLNRRAYLLTSYMGCPQWALTTCLGSFLPKACMAIGYCRCLRLSVRPCVNHLLVRAITRDPFKLG